ncbi:hypothetical protein AGR56_09040 [Clostridium sp. DMHC 10]|uniref:hypothetical protein n=1 Tax=Clostridium sp. DMHC 10 TaxID=747377 RepID=UPI00069F8C04|nr:hypothetical protein [Clostridium sp. DMHC 10]KOF56800.1 hypothetical protein AGR56_09040 [Clostridium sp. DMHC 10]
MLENATVTINYKEFEKIKEKADRCDKLEKEKKEDKEGKLIDKVLSILEKGIASESEHKQWYLVQALKTFYDEWNLNIYKEFKNLDKGIAPNKGEVNND